MPITEKDAAPGRHPAPGADPAAQCCQVAEIEAGLRQAEAGAFATEAEVDAAYAAFR